MWLRLKLEATNYSVKGDRIRVDQWEGALHRGREGEGVDLLRGGNKGRCWARDLFLQNIQDGDGNETAVRNNMQITY